MIDNGRKGLISRFQKLRDEHCLIGWGISRTNLESCQFERTLIRLRVTDFPKLDSIVVLILQSGNDGGVT